ncbi:unnamed protein product [Darwinula stevensoni]|uniref:Uncharacterized protein n=1 Tax=Darwinula stevensoni TaxID=69355 RepID=A0A7R9FQZ8_9CRUS|nr:unnamed protein product [Darwinula stevensoni]CAG0900453.1 unnamed protein product [Darwinula stevensoni]
MWGWFRHLPIVQDRYHCLGGRARMASSTIWASHRLRVHLLQLLHFNWVDVLGERGLFPAGASFSIGSQLSISKCTRTSCPRCIISPLAKFRKERTVLGEWDDILQAGAPFSIAWHLQAYRNSSPSNNYLSRGTKFRCWVRDETFSSRKPLLHRLPAQHLQVHRPLLPNMRHLLECKKWVTSMVRQLQKLREMTLVATSSACRRGLALHRNGRQNFHTSHMSMPRPLQRIGSEGKKRLCLYPWRRVVGL